MDYVEIALLLAGFVLLVLGYRRNRRGWLVAAALLLFLSGNLEPMVSGFAEGWASAGQSASIAAGHH
ncbi:hypothetical protein [Dyella lutea]|uniref:Concentrative nucleoside transporter N-terminal domain-containing protein n=1 Tax=Dyella lutea TaxID=2950441 RepID=A0ABT1FFS2_9GAMM|nr:hypothetical protein [Dyella lutea]MCP1376236.1 hypothetical protein [Dyella lutea]